MPVLPYPVAKAVCYLRKSREDEQAELRGEDTLQSQRSMLTVDVLSRYTFPYDLAEEVASGDSIRDRPVFRALLPKLGDTYQAIVCKDLSRLGRGSYSDMGVLYDTLRDRRILVITKDAVYDPENFSDLRMIRFSLFFNREEYEMTLWRLTEGKNDGAAQGKWVAGSVPYGCQYNPRTQTLQPSPDAVVVQLVFAWYTDEGLGCRAIATRLTKMGYRTPKGLATWHPEVVRRMLRNPAYHGTLVFRATRRNKLDGKVVRRPQSEQIIVENAFDPLVSPSTWAKAQSRLSNHESRPRVKHGCEAWELASVVRCRSCRRKLVRQSSQQHYRRKDGVVSVYDKEFLYCAKCGYAVKYRDCESQLIAVLTHLHIPGCEELAAPVQVVGGTLMSGHQTEELAHIEKRQRELLTRRLEKARELLIDGTLTKSEYLQLKSRYTAAVQALPAAPAGQAVQTSTPADPNAAVSSWMHGLATLADVYHKLPDTQLRNRLLRQVFRSVQLSLLSEGGGRNRPTRFNLEVQLAPGWITRWKP